MAEQNREVPRIEDPMKSPVNTDKTAHFCSHDDYRRRDVIETKIMKHVRQPVETTV